MLTATDCTAQAQVLQLVRDGREQIRVRSQRLHRVHSLIRVLLLRLIMLAERLPHVFHCERASLAPTQLLEHEVVLRCSTTIRIAANTALRNIN